MLALRAHPDRSRAGSRRDRGALPYPPTELQTPLPDRSQSGSARDAISLQGQSGDLSDYSRRDGTLPFLGPVAGVAPAGAADLTPRTYVDTGDATIYAASAADNTALQGAVLTYADAHYRVPVGFIVITDNATNPATTLGYGTWAAFGAGRVLVGLDAGDVDFDTVLETGGAKTVAAAGSNSGTAVADHAAHKHTYSDLVNHTHAVTVTDPGHVHNQGYVNDTTGGTKGVQGSNAANNATIANAVPSHTTGISASTANPAGGGATGTTNDPSITLSHTVSAEPTFTGSATSVVQPYVVVYYWRRTA